MLVAAATLSFTCATEEDFYNAAAANSREPHALSHAKEYSLSPAESHTLPAAPKEVSLDLRIFSENFAAEPRVRLA